MPLPSVSFVLGLLLLAYLSTFVLFAFLRIVTGVSIQRVGYSGFRRIAFTLRDGISIRIRGLGLSIRRPTFAQPTWISLTITELQVLIDLKALSSGNTNASDGHANGSPESAGGSPQVQATAREERAKKWQTLLRWKERIKRLHRQVEWLRLVDVLVLGLSVTIIDVGTIRVERFGLLVDTRAKTVDRSKLFQNHQPEHVKRRPAEWKCLIRSILLMPHGKESTEIMDYCTLNVHGFLHTELDGLRDASIALKIGRYTVPFDDVEEIAAKLRRHRDAQKPSRSPSKTPHIAINGEEQTDFTTAEDNAAILDAISDSKEFASSIFRGIQEVQLAVGFLGVSKRFKMVTTAGQHVYFNLAIKEIGLDLTRLEPRSPAHRMYFSPKDTAHQALLTAIAISAGIDGGTDRPERLLYIPMVTATVKTTLPSKIVQLSSDPSSSDRNTNILFANLVCTSPSVDLNPRHFPLILSFVEGRKSRSMKRSNRGTESDRHISIARLLPRAIVKVAVQEPVLRVCLPHHASEREYDMIISSVSAMSLDVEAQHETAENEQYSLSLHYRQTAHRLYGQTFDGTRHDLLFADTLELKVNVDALPELSVFIEGKIQTFSVYLIQPEICGGLRQIVQALRKNHLPPTHKSSTKQSFLRRLPAYLQHVSLQGSDFNMEIAGYDMAVSKYARGMAFQLDSWTTEYKAHRDDNYIISRRRSTSRNSPHGHRSRHSDPPASPRKRPMSATDGTRLAFHMEGLEGLIIDSLPDSRPETFLSLPNFEVAFSTSTDQHGRLFHINAKAEKLFVYYSLYNHFAIGIAWLVLRNTLTPSVSDEHGSQSHSHKSPEYRSTQSPSFEENDAREISEPTEITAIDFRAGMIQIKANMPADPPLMLQVFGIEAGKHRWAAPFVRSRLLRLYAGTPQMTSVWSRIVSIKTIKIDLRSMKRKVGKGTVDERSLDIATEAVRIGVPHQLIVHSIFDNIVNVMKTTQQLHHHFATGTSEYVLSKTPEGPKNIPKINVRSQVLIFEIEDSPFEYKLGVIYRTGLIEQKQRLAREEAFRLKSKKLQSKNSRGGHHTRPQSAQPRGREGSTDTKMTGHQRSKSATTSSINRGRTGHLRYDADGTCEMNTHVSRSVEQAREALDKFNSESWKNRVDQSMRHQKHAMQHIRSFFWGVDETPEELEETEPIMALSTRPGLMTLCISDISVAIDKPSFPLKDLPNYLHEIGKGMPMDMKYGLLLPMSLNISMGEVRGTLRDYPLPLIHIPAIKSGQSPRLPSLHLSTDFVIAEEFRGIESQRHVNVVVVPTDKLGPDDKAKRFAVDVRRTVSPVKTYTNMKIDINTSAPTRITWGTSYQPAIQDMMQVIEGFTKPPVDPSDRVGFWDKIRLSFHSRITVSWKGDGDFHLNLKGSRDPYIVTGSGAGFVMVWRNNVQWKIAQDKDPRRFMTVDSGDYILAIPDYSHHAQQSEKDDAMDHSSTPAVNHRSTANFRKVVMKLSGNVQWLAGLVFERAIEGDKRSFDFDNHWNVILKHPDYAKATPGQTYDAYKGIRSQFIHMSIAVVAPQSRDWNVLNIKPSDNYNSVHLTPRVFTHFLNWWHLFSGVVSLPIRQGPLWTQEEKSSKKFGRHLATIKYNLLLSPLFISHIYKHKEVEDYGSDSVAATGLKLKLDSFMLDLHQRRENFEIPGDVDGRPKKTSGMKINQCQLDFISGDIRAVSASIRGTTKDEIEHADPDTLSTNQTTAPKVDMSRFTIPDNDLTWIDMDDFVELDWILPQESNPETKILPLAMAPRFTYFRQTDHGDNVSGDETRTSPFGEEATHYCVMSHKNDPRRVQADLIQQRLNKIVEQVANNERAIGEQHLKTVRDPKKDQKLREDLDTLRNHTEALQHKHEFLDGMLKVLLERLEQDDASAVPGLETSEEPLNDTEQGKRTAYETAGLDAVPIGDNSRDFNNRFVVHNAQIKWNNSLRNIILRYVHQVSQRRGFVYYTSRRAVKFILDIIDEKKKRREANTAASPSRQQSIVTDLNTPGMEDDLTVQDRIEQILADGKAFVEADDQERSKPHSKSPGEAGEEEISKEFVAQNTYHFRLIAPQIQLQSEKSPKSVMLVAAKGMQLKVIQIMDKDRVVDEVSGLVQRRFTAAMDSLQVFVTSTKTFSMNHLHMYSGNRYGTKAGAYWPPWVPMEVMYDFSNNPYGFARVVQRTSASLRYDKFNNLRLKYNDDVTKGQEDDDDDEENIDNRMDQLTVEFPHFRAICDSGQYYTMYVIVVDLLLYSEPLEKTRSERLEKIMLASDFSDLTGAPELVEMLQGRIRQLEEIKMHFQINEKLLDRQGWKDRISMDEDLTSCEDELFFMMKAITTSQQRIDDRNNQDGSNGILRWLITAKEVAWHLIRDQNESLLEFQLKDTSFDRTDNSDGSNVNCIEFGRINGFNLLPNALYPQMFAPYVDEARGLHDLGPKQKMLRVRWLMMEAIAGIPVVDYFEVDIVPIRAQMEREVAKKLFEYIFPGVGGNAFEENGFSPFIVKKMLPTQDEEDEDGNVDGSNMHNADSVPNTGNATPEPNKQQGTGNGAGALENRLQPTLNLADNKSPKKPKQGLGLTNGALHWSIFQHSNRSQTGIRRGSRDKLYNSSSNLASSRTPSQQSLADSSINASLESDKPKKSRRSHSQERKKDKETPSDDLTEMMSRASNYMTLSHFKVHGLVLCLSYKGRGQRNLEDVHDLVFRLPTFEYRNKTWSNLDLALQMKKDIIKSLISHAGAIVGNKLSHHRPNRQQQSRLREVANSSLMMSISHDFQPSATPSSDGARSADGSLDHDADSGDEGFRMSTERPEARRTPSFNNNGSASSTPQKYFQNGNGGAERAPSIASSNTRKRFSSLNVRGRSAEEGNEGTGEDREKDREATRMKSRLLLGGQKLLQKLPHRE